MNEAEALLRDGIKRGWNAELVELYGRVRTDNPEAQLASAEAWLRGRPEDPSLLLTLGRLCLQNQLWGKARSYLESSLKRRPMAQTYGELAALMGQLGEADKAFDYYRRGLESTVSELSGPASLPPTTVPTRRRASG